MQAEAFEIVERIVERVDFQLAAVAGTGIDLADRQRAAELGARGAFEALGKLGERRLVGCGAGSVSGPRVRLSNSVRRIRGRAPNTSS